MQRKKMIFVIVLLVGVSAAGCESAENSSTENSVVDSSNPDDTGRDTQYDTNAPGDTTTLQDTTTLRDTTTLQDTTTSRDTSAPKDTDTETDDTDSATAASCTLDGRTLAVGESYYDGCNSHTCNGNGWVESTDRECSAYCVVGNEPFAIGEVVFDGCNFHSCSENGPSETAVDCFVDCEASTGEVYRYGESAPVSDVVCDCLKFGELYCYTPGNAEVCFGPTISAPEGDISNDYAIGSSWAADDSRNECKCLSNGEIVCTHQVFASAATCFFEGETLVPGEIRFDGYCNYHTCESDGSISKTNNDC
jgi:hypothetical protein